MSHLAFGAFPHEGGKQTAPFAGTANTPTIITDTKDSSDSVPWAAFATPGLWIARSEILTYLAAILEVTLLATILRLRSWRCSRCSFWFCLRFRFGFWFCHRLCFGFWFCHRFSFGFWFCHRFRFGFWSAFALGGAAGSVGTGAAAAVSAGTTARGGFTGPEASRCLLEAWGVARCKARFFLSASASCSTSIWLFSSTLAWVTTMSLGRFGAKPLHSTCRGH